MSYKTDTARLRVLCDLLTVVQASKASLAYPTRLLSVEAELWNEVGSTLKSLR